MDVPPGLQCSGFTSPDAVGLGLILLPGADGGSAASVVGIARLDAGRPRPAGFRSHLSLQEAVCTRQQQPGDGGWTGPGS